MTTKIALILTAVTTLAFTGCSSYPDSAEGVADAVCSEFKAGDLKGAELYMSDTALAKANENETVISQFFALAEFKEKAAKLDCSKPVKSENLGNDHKVIHFDGFKVELKKMDGDWKLIG